MAPYIEEAAAYCRVSREEQMKHGLSIEAQKQKLNEYAEKNNLKIVKWYLDEGVSGRKPIAKRPELQRMIHDAQEKKFTRIIFIKLDRYFRSVQEYYTCQSILDKANVAWTATEEKYSLADANGRAFVNMKLTIAELEADTTGERIKIVNDYKVKSGMPLYGAHCLPFCYTIEGGKQKSIKKANQEIMEDALEYVMIHHSVSATLRYIKSKHETNISYKALMRSFRNEMICGSYRGNPNYCPPYISKEVFDKLQTIINRPMRTSAAEYTYIFSGLVRCPCCGNTLKGAFSTTRGRRYYAYRCNKAIVDRECDFRSMIFEKTLEKKMIACVEDKLRDTEIKNIEISKKEKTVSKYNVKELQAELDRLNYSWQKGRIKSVEEYDKKYDALIAMIEEAENEVQETPVDYSHIRETLTDGWKTIYAALDNDHKKSFWRSFVKEVHLDWNKDKKEIADVIFF